MALSYNSSRAHLPAPCAYATFLFVYVCCGAAVLAVAMLLAVESHKQTFPCSEELLAGDDTITVGIGRVEDPARVWLALPGPRQGNERLQLLLESTAEMRPRMA